ncbi:MAG: hypothetical protein IRY91_10440 [Gemmatimonadaceae bacterium]|nr:hypothetical protein [Gemmatimonadaceae bacterium]
MTQRLLAPARLGAVLRAARSLARTTLGWPVLSRVLDRIPRPRIARLTVGIAIAADRVCAVGVSDGRIRWAVDAERAPGEPVGPALDVLLARAPLPRRPRPAVAVAVGPAAVQVKRLSGLPPLTDVAALGALVRESAGRFFLRNGVPLVTSDVRIVAPGTAWAAAFDAQIVHDVQQHCAAARLSLRAIVPTVVALGYACEAERLAWSDGGVYTTMTFAGRVLSFVRRLPGRPPAGAAMPAPVAPLAALGARAWELADAYGATCVPRTEPLALRKRPGAAEAPIARRRIVIAALACAVASLGALAAPALVARHVARRDAARLAALRRAEAQTVAAERDLAQVTAALCEVATFTEGRRSVTLLLRDVARMLPKGSALVAFTVDSAGGTLVALAPRAAHVVDALEHVPGLASPEIIGPVTTEMAGTTPVERVTVRFRLVGEPPRAPAASVPAPVRRPSPAAGASR